MTKIYAIAQREVSAVFSTPIGYIVGALYLLSSGLVFYFYLLGTRSAELGGYFESIQFLAVLTVPFLTMGSLTQERRNRSLELLISHPLTEGQIVLGKFFGLAFVACALLLGPGASAIVISRFGAVDAGAVSVQILGLAILSLYVVGLGVIWSAYADSQLLAGLGGVVLGLLLWSLDLKRFGGVGHVLSVRLHLEGFRGGLLDLGDVGFFLAWTSIWLAVAGILLAFRQR